MNILNMFLHAKKDDLLEQLGASFSVDKDQASAALTALMASLGSKTEAKIQSGGLAALMQQFSAMEAKDVLEAPETLDSSLVQEQGQQAMRTLLDNSEQQEVIKVAATASGISEEITQQITAAVIASVGGYFKNSFSGADGGLQALMGGADGTGFADMLGNLLDQDDDGQVLDDIGNIAKKLF